MVQAKDHNNTNSTPSLFTEITANLFPGSRRLHPGNTAVAANLGEFLALKRHVQVPSPPVRDVYLRVGSANTSSIDYDASKLPKLCSTPSEQTRMLVQWSI